MTKKQEWFSLAQASLKLERGSTYVSVWLRRHPNELPSEMLMETGKVKLISEDGIEWIKNHIKKRASSSAVELLTGISTWKLRF